MNWLLVEVVGILAPILGHFIYRNVLGPACVAYWLERIAPRPPRGWVASSAAAERAAGLVYEQVSDRVFFLWPGYWEYELDGPDSFMLTWRVRPQDHSLNPYNIWADPNWGYDRAMERLKTGGIKGIKKPSPQAPPEKVGRDVDYKPRVAVLRATPERQGRVSCGGIREIGSHIYKYGDPHCIYCGQDW